MAIIQISKLQQRTGNLVDLPQLDDGEFGWATDAKRLYIGKTTPNENIEVLTTYSNISFSQLDGAVGNLNMNSVTNGQILTYVASTNTWENYTGSTQLNGGKLQLGDVANISMTGAAGIGYVLSTDGIGNLSWTPKGTLQANIKALSNANPIIMTVPNTLPLTNGAQVTITGVQGTNANSIVNGQSFYVTLSNNYNTSGNVKLYTDVGRTSGANGFYLTATANTGVATSVISGGGGTSGAGGANTSVQFNDQNISNGVAGFTFDKVTTTLTVSGPINGTTIGASTSVTSPILVSNIATGTAPLTVTSTTRVANLNVATSGVANTVNDAAQPNITSVGTLTSLSVSGNANVGNLGTTGVYATTLSATGNANVGNIGATAFVTPATTINSGITTTGNANVGNLGTTGVFATTLSATGNANVGNIGATNIVGTLSTASQTNITAVGTLATLSVTGNANVGNIGATLHVGNLSGTGNSNVGNLGATGIFATTLSATGNANVGNIGATNGVFSNVSGNGALLTSITGANVTGAVAFATTANSVAGANVSGAVAFATTANAVAGANVSGAVAFATTANAVAGANVTGTVSSATTAGTVTTAAQPNITSVSSSFTSLSFANAQTITANNVTISTGANTNLGTLTGNWSLSSGSRLQATYADLAEYYEADQQYEPGTVLQFGGAKEVILAEDGTTRVAGVVSTDPAYVMNSSCEGNAVALALQGRVPTKVRGTIRKGDLMISGGNGFARPAISPVVGSVIGKALQDFDGIEGIIEVAVGRL
jgi:hypothetical protein